MNIHGWVPLRLTGFISNSNPSEYSGFSSFKIDWFYLQLFVLILHVLATALADYSTFSLEFYDTKSFWFSSSLDSPTGTPYAGVSSALPWAPILFWIHAFPRWPILFHQYVGDH